jgi:hypothetical protein
LEDVFAWWLKVPKALKKEDRIYGQMIVEKAKKHPTWG